MLQGAVGKLPWHKTKLLAGALQTASPVETFAYLRSFGKDFAPVVEDGILRSTDPSSAWFEQAATSFAMDLSDAEVGMRLDLGFMLPEAYLQKVDVATMTFSLEARCPMVDYRMVEWSMRLPLRYKIRGRETKYLLKKLLCRHLPAELVYRPKQGFGVPIAQWLRGPLRSWAQDLIHDSQVTSRLPIDLGRLDALFKLHVSGKRDAHPVLWAALMLLCFVARHDCGLELPKLISQKAA
jgi:asparagine synthase (glutamine-hydrolysing)